MSKVVFVACPIGGEESAERLRSDKLWKYVIGPAVSELLPDSDTRIVRSDKIEEPGRITSQIIREIVSADVVLADVTGLNPNVMYEVGLRQALVKPLVLMAEKGQNLPFDMIDLRTIFYQLDLDGAEAAKTSLKEHLQKAFEGSVSSIDQMLFQPRVSVAGDGASKPPQELLAVAELCEGILKEAQETKKLIYTVGGVCLDIQESLKNVDEIREEASKQQLGMMMMSQFLQNPDAMEKVIPAVQKLAEFGNKVENMSKRQKKKE